MFDLALLCGIGLLLCLILHEDVVLFTVAFDLILFCPQLMFLLQVMCVLCIFNHFFTYCMVES